jgi:hypothetical protein
MTGGELVGRSLTQLDLEVEGGIGAGANGAVLEDGEVFDRRVVEGFYLPVEGLECREGLRGCPVFCFVPGGLEPGVDEIEGVVGDGLDALDGTDVGRARGNAITVNGRVEGDGCVQAAGDYSQFESVGDGLEGGLGVTDVGGAFTIDGVLGLEELAGLEDVEVEGAGGCGAPGVSVGDGEEPGGGVFGLWRIWGLEDEVVEEVAERAGD